MTIPDLSILGWCLHADRLHLGIECFFFVPSQFISGRSLETRMSCKFLGLLYPIIGILSTRDLVAELLYRIGHNSSIHSFKGGNDGL